MNKNYKVLKTFEKKEARFTALIEYKNEKAVLKKITTDSKVLKNKFLNERNILTTIDKPYIPKVYEYGDDYLIMEYFESYNNKPEEFLVYVDDLIVDKIVDQLYDLNTTVLSNIEQSNPRLLYKIYKVILKLWKGGGFRFFYIKVLYMLTTIYLKNKKLFNLEVVTKGDFTEVNILVKKDEVKFIDFDEYKRNGAWLEDASYLLLHQDIEVDKLSWQKIFFKNYLLKMKENGIELSKEYIMFWLLYTSVNQYSIRFFQYKCNSVNFENNELASKEEHITYFLDKNKFNAFIKELGID